MRINKSVENLKKELTKRIDDSISAIMHAISRAESESLKGRDELKRTIELLERDMVLMRNIKEKLETLRDCTVKSVMKGIVNNP